MTDYQKRMLKAEIGIGLSEYYIERLDTPINQAKKLHEKHTKKILENAERIINDSK